MRQVLPDVWETQQDNPFPGLTTHTYLRTGWTNALFCSVAADAEFGELERHGGIADHYLSHKDEAGPMLARIADEIGSRLRAPASDEIGHYAEIDVPLVDRHVDDNSVEVIPTPGHTPGSTCYLVPGADNIRYLFTGDTLFLSGSGTWKAGCIDSFSDADSLAQSLRLLATVGPNVVISSAFAGISAVHRVDPPEWPQHIDQALAGLPASA